MFKNIVDKYKKDNYLNKIIHHDIQHKYEEFHKALMNEASLQKATEVLADAKSQ